MQLFRSREWGGGRVTTEGREWLVAPIHVIKTHGGAYTDRQTANGCVVFVESIQRHSRSHSQARKWHPVNE